MTSYLIEFGPAWPIPPITVDYSDPNQAARTVAKHAVPHLTPKLTEMGRPELADCYFSVSRDRTIGAFMHPDLAAGSVTRFCPARLKPTDLDPDICGDTNDTDVCEQDPGHDGNHLTGDGTVGWPIAFAILAWPFIGLALLALRRPARNLRHRLTNRKDG